MRDDIDRKLIAITQAGLPLVATPYAALADELQIKEDEVLVRMRRLLDEGSIRRIGAIPNHYAVGVTANGMSVWDVADDVAADAGALIGTLDFVTHCYERPRHPPMWPYNLFAMVHGRNRDEVKGKVAQIAELLGKHARGHDVLFSSRILKKTGLRIAA